MTRSTGDKEVELIGVSVSYGHQVALDNISLDVASGETMAVIGPSGSGKSTLLRVVAGLEAPSNGAVNLGGKSMDTVPTHRRDLGLMFQDDVLFPHLSVGANVGFGLKMSGWSRKQRRTRVDEWLALVGLGGFADRQVHELSGGEAQRVALARSLAPEPRLLMLDEPFGSLDQVLRRELTVELRGLLAELGQSALHVTHDQEEAFAIADRVAVINHGQLEQVDIPEQLWRRPLSKFVARFVGHHNIWSLSVGAGSKVFWGDYSVGVAKDWPPGTYDVVVPIDAIQVEPDGRPADQDQLDKVGIELVVADTRWDLGRYQVEGVASSMVSCNPNPNEPRVRFESASRLDVGEPVYLTVDLEKVHWF